MYVYGPVFSMGPFLDLYAVSTNGLYLLVNKNKLVQMQLSVLKAINGYLYWGTALSISRPNSPIRCSIAVTPADFIVHGGNVILGPGRLMCILAITEWIPILQHQHRIPWFDEEGG